MHFIHPWLRRSCIASLEVAALIGVLSCGDPSAQVTESAHTSQLAVAGADTQPVELVQAAPGVVNILFKIMDHASGGSKHRLCGGTYIDAGVIITAKHCYEVDSGKIIAHITIFFGDQTAMTKTEKMASFGYYAAPLSQWTLVSHPHQDLGLMIFNVAELSYGQPDRAPLFERPPDQHGPLYQNVTFFGLGQPGLGKIKQYDRLAKAQQLYALVHGGELWPTVWHMVHSNLHWYDKGVYLVRTLLSPASTSSSSCLPFPRHPHRCQPLLYGRSPAYLLVGSTLSHLPALKAPQDVVFCRGDSGGGVRLADGSLVGIAIGYSVRINNYVGIEFGTNHNFDDELMRDRDCSSVMYALDLQPYLPWIRESIAAAMH